MDTYTDEHKTTLIKALRVLRRLLGEEYMQRIIQETLPALIDDRIYELTNVQTQIDNLTKMKSDLLKHADNLYS